jgi:glutamate synthase (NADPH) small chain
MPNMSRKKVQMPTQSGQERIHNFNEVALGYTPEMAMEEAQRCLGCKTRPCVNGCPVNVNIPDFISQVALGQFEEAYETITKTNNLPGICGRVCPQETQCEQQCVRAIKGESVAIGRLERFCADVLCQDKKPIPFPSAPQKGCKVAVIGSGPASLTCAADLAQMGYPVTIFEAFHTPGGVLMYGIPEFRLPKLKVQEEIKRVKDLGVEVVTNMVVGKIVTVDELFEEGYKAVFIGTGAGLPSFMGISGEHLNGVYSSNEFLTRINLMKAYDFPNVDTPVWVGDRVAVIGGGNVAMDCARSAKRLGAKEVFIVYRRSKEEMPARLEEIHHAEEEGIQFQLLCNPTKIEGAENGWVRSISLVQMRLGKPDADGRAKPEEIPGSDFNLPTDTLIVAIGQTPNPLIQNTTPELQRTSRGTLIVDKDTYATTKRGVFAGGDAVTGAATVIQAMGAGKKAALSISRFLEEGLDRQIEETQEKEAHSCPPSE